MEHMLALKLGHQLLICLGKDVQANGAAFFLLLLLLLYVLLRLRIYVFLDFGDPLVQLAPLPYLPGASEHPDANIEH